MILHGKTRVANRLAILLASLAAMASLPVAADAQLWYPNRGEVWFDGYSLVDLHFMWEDRNDAYYDAGYEHNLAINASFYDTCTSVTNMPGSFDDCDTAGWFENDPSEIVFAFGTFHLRHSEIVASSHPEHVSGNYPPHEYTWYWGNIDMGCSGNTASSCTGFSTPFRVYAQEVQRTFCDFDNVGCMNGIQSKVLVSDGWEFRKPENWEYHFNPATGALVYRAQF